MYQIVQKNTQTNLRIWQRKNANTVINSVHNVQVLQIKNVKNAYLLILKAKINAWKGVQLEHIKTQLKMQKKTRMIARFVIKDVLSVMALQVIIA